jgi:hypothetical protein
MKYTKEQLLNVRFHTNANNPLIFKDNPDTDKLRIFHVDRVGGEQYGVWSIDRINDMLEGEGHVPWVLDSPLNMLIHPTWGRTFRTPLMHALLTGNKPDILIEDDMEEDVEDSGGSCNYYQVDVMNPTTPSNNEGEHMNDATYTAECNDIIESLDMTYAEANMFKEIWRTAAARTLGKQKAGHTTQRGAEKIVFFAHRHAVQHGVDNEQ